MYIMKDFKEKRIAVRVGKEHMMEFLRMCEAAGLRWWTGKKPTDFNPCVLVDENICVTLHCRYVCDGLTYGRRSTYEKQGLTIVDFKEFATQPRREGKTMTIEEIKEALREVRRICTENRFCKDCPLAVDGCCPMSDTDGESADYPEYWALDWEGENT